MLGVPGLINAYKTATLEAIHAAEIIERTVNDVYLLKFDYLHLNEVMTVLKDENLSYQNQIFDNDCSLEISVRKAQLNTVINKLEKIEGLVCTYLLSC